MQAITDIPAAPNFAAADALVFTSRNAVDRFAVRWVGRALPAFCVGATTAEAARAIGLKATAAQGDLPSLAALLARQPAQRLLYLHGKHLSGDMALALSATSHRVQSHVIYDQPALDLPEATLRAVEAGEIDAAALFSPRAARLLAQALSHKPPLHCFCLSNNVADAAKSLGPCTVAAAPNATALLAVIGAGLGGTV